jgi:hypothetical protein
MEGSNDHQCNAAHGLSLDSPFDKIPAYAPPTRYVFVPVMIATGLWMWKGHVVRRLLSKRPAEPDAAHNA